MKRIDRAMNLTERFVCAVERIAKALEAQRDYVPPHLYGPRGTEIRHALDGGCAPAPFVGDQVWTGEVKPAWHSAGVAGNGSG